jgi:hypothetical protein
MITHIYIFLYVLNKNIFKSCVLTSNKKYEIDRSVMGYVRCSLSAALQASNNTALLSPNLTVDKNFLMIITGCMYAGIWVGQYGI